MGGTVTCRRPDKTVYILGAGFSRPAGIPVLGRFIPEAFAVLKRSKDRTLFDRFAELVRTYQAAARQMQLDADNLETLFCLSDLSEQRRRDRTDLIRVITRTVFESCKCHDCNKAHGNECCVPPRYLARNETINAMNHARVAFGVCIYKAFLSQIFRAQREHHDGREIQVEDLHSVLTFNYDLVLESAMKDVEDCFVCYGEDIVSYVVPSNGPAIRQTTYGPFAPRTLHYLKIHGSLNWAVEDGSKYSYVTVRPIDAARQGRQLMEIPLVPPTWKRGAQDDDIYSRLLSEAIEHLRLAGRIVIIGYSMPPTDTYFKYVLATAISTPEFPQIEVWDVKPRGEMIPHLESIFGSENLNPSKGRVRYEDTGLEGFVKQEAGRVAAQEKSP